MYFFVWYVQRSMKTWKRRAPKSWDTLSVQCYERRKAEQTHNMYDSKASDPKHFPMWDDVKGFPGNSALPSHDFTSLCTWSYWYAQSALYDRGKNMFPQMKQYWIFPGSSRSLRNYDLKIDQIVFNRHHRGISHRECSWSGLKQKHIPFVKWHISYKGRRDWNRADCGDKWCALWSCIVSTTTYIVAADNTYYFLCRPLHIKGHFFCAHGLIYDIKISHPSGSFQIVRSLWWLTEFQSSFF